MFFVTVGAQHEPGYKEFSFGFMGLLNGYSSWRFENTEFNIVSASS